MSSANDGEGGAVGDAPRILAFSTTGISDLGIDLAGGSHMDYPTSVLVVPVPCSSGIKPSWVVHALDAGFDGVFIAADGTDCAYVNDCTDRTGKVVARSQELMEKSGHDPRRLKMAAICSVCAESFVSHVKKFQTQLTHVSPS